MHRSSRIPAPQRSSSFRIIPIGGAQRVKYHLLYVLCTSCMFLHAYIHAVGHNMAKHLAVMSTNEMCDWNTFFFRRQCER